MSFASPFPEVDIPSTSVYDYLFGASMTPISTGSHWSTPSRAGRPPTAR